MINKSMTMSFLIVFFLIINIPSINGAQINLGNKITASSLNVIPYSSTPDWESDNPAYSTGAALADFNKDGWLDLVVADGNDMSPGYVNVYYNDKNGNLPTTASWKSDDIGYNGHLDVADVNGDGWPDVAVSYLGTSSSFGPIARVYLNNDGVLSSSPDWTSDITGNSFGVDFGDMNNDGRPDLAVATGWCYSPQHYYNNYVYLNIDGNLSSLPSWDSEDTNTYMGCHWVDADDDGWLDLAYIGSFAETAIYKNIGGTLERTASWNTQDSKDQDGIMLTTGDVDHDGIKDLFATDNIQLGGDGMFKQYLGLFEGFFETTNSWNYYEGYGSAVALADVNYDNKLDLATGAWWDYTRIFLNDGSGLPSSPSWTSGGTSVGEKIVFGNVGPTFDENTYEDTFPVSGNRKLFYLSHQNIQKINSVILDGDILDPSEYTYSREHCWITVDSAPAVSVEVSYNYSKSLDMVISNWDSDKGNYLYYNQIIEDKIPDLECMGDLSWEGVTPDSTVTGSFTIENIGDSDSELNWAVTEFPEWGEWTFTPDSGSDLTPEMGPQTVDVKVTSPSDKNKEFTGRIKVVNTDNPSDYCEINIYLKTPRSRTVNYPIFSRIMNCFPNVFPILRYIIDRYSD
jgi:hypothetical protein